MKYAALLDVLVEHAFYTDKRCPDFAIEPDDRTMRLLRGHRCLLRPRPDGLSIVTPLGDDKRPFLPLPKCAILRFFLRLTNDDFALFTDLSKIEPIVEGGRRPVFANLNEPGELKLSSRPLRKGERVRPFAEILILFRQGAPGAPAATYRAKFEPKEARWAYYCVTGLPPGDLKIVDGTTELDRDPNPQDPIAAQLEKLYPERNRIRFRSKALIPCSQAPRKTLKLLLGEETLLHPLPNPSPQSFTKAGDYCLFHIIKYDTNPGPSSG